MTYNELMELDVDDIPDIYRGCRDTIVQDQCFMMGLKGINYKEPSKCGTDYYMLYLNKMENRNEPIDKMTELMNQYGLKHKVKNPEFLIKKKTSRREVLQ